MSEIKTIMETTVKFRMFDMPGEEKFYNLTDYQIKRRLTRRCNTVVFLGEFETKEIGEDKL